MTDMGFILGDWRAYLLGIAVFGGSGVKAVALDLVGHEGLFPSGGAVRAGQHVGAARQKRTRCYPSIRSWKVGRMHVLITRSRIQYFFEWRSLRDTNLDSAELLTFPFVDAACSGRWATRGN